MVPATDDMVLGWSCMIIITVEEQNFITILLLCHMMPWIKKNEINY